MRKLWKLAVIGALFACIGLSGNSAQGSSSDTCNLPGRIACSPTCEQWCGPASQGYYCAVGCCFCIR